MALRISWPGLISAVKKGLRFFCAFTRAPVAELGFYDSVHVWVEIKDDSWEMVADPSCRFEPLLLLRLVLRILPFAFASFAISCVSCSRLTFTNFFYQNYPQK